MAVSKLASKAHTIKYSTRKLVKPQSLGESKTPPLVSAGGRFLIRRVVVKNPSPGQPEDGPFLLRYGFTTAVICRAAHTSS